MPPRGHCCCYSCLPIFCIFPLLESYLINNQGNFKTIFTDTLDPVLAYFVLLISTPLILQIQWCSWGLESSPGLPERSGYLTKKVLYDSAWVSSYTGLGAGGEPTTSLACLWLLERIQVSLYFIVYRIGEKCMAHDQGFVLKPPSVPHNQVLTFKKPKSPAGISFLFSVLGNAALNSMHCICPRSTSEPVQMLHMSSNQLTETSRVCHTENSPGPLPCPDLNIINFFCCSLFSYIPV